MNIIKKIFSPVCLAISILLLIYTFYKSEIYWNSVISDYYFTYYIISSLLIIFSIITFFISQKIKEYLIISLVGIIISLYTLEGYLTFKEQLTKQQLTKIQQLTKKQQLYEKETGKKYDKRTRLEIYEDLKKANNEITVTVAPSYYLNENYNIFPLSGISNSETIYCNDNGYYSIYQSDRYGFNNPDEEWDILEIEYILVGDSFTQGACVNRLNDIASVLRTLSNKSVLNLGYSGNGPLIEYATLREYLKLNVKTILWIYFEGNDLNNLTNETKNKILKNYLNNLTFTQNLKLKQNEINKLANTYIERQIEIVKVKEKEKEKERERVEQTFKFKLIKFIKIFNLRILLLQKTKSQAEAEVKAQTQLEFKKIIELANDLTIKNNSKLYFIYLPEYRRYKTKYDNSNYFLVKRIVNELGIPFIDIHSEVFEKKVNPLKLFPFDLSFHYNVEGYKKVAESIYKFTKD